MDRLRFEPASVMVFIPDEPSDDSHVLEPTLEQNRSSLPFDGHAKPLYDSPTTNLVEPLPTFAEYSERKKFPTRKEVSSESWLSCPSLVRSSRSTLESDLSGLSDQDQHPDNRQIITEDTIMEDVFSSDHDATTDASNDFESGAASDMETDWEEMEGGRDQWYNEIWMSNLGKRHTNLETRQIRRERLLKETKNQKLIDMLMCEFYNIFRKATIRVRSCAGGQYFSSREQLYRENIKTDSSLTRTIGTGRTGGGKDNGEEEEEEGGEEEEDRPQKRLKQVHKPHQTKLPGLKFACPFHQHNPRKYGIGDMLCDANYRSCAGPGFLSIARMKEYLYRRHRIPIRWNRCSVIFKSQEYLKAHVRVLAPCEVQPEVPLEGVTEEIEKRLKSRNKASPCESDEDRWRAVYHILFPDEEIPSPYYENANAVAAFQEYSDRETPRVFLRMLENRASTNQLTKEIRDELVDIVQECRIYVYRKYNQEVIRKPLVAIDGVDAAIPALSSNDSQSDNSNAEARFQPQDDIEDPASYDPADFESIFQDHWGKEYNWGPVAQYQCFCFGPCSCPPFPSSKNLG